MICTYLHPHEHNLPIENKQVKEVLDLLRKVSGELWVVHELRRTIGKWWWKKPYNRYILMRQTNGIEFEEMNFYRADSEITLNVIVPADIVVAYMYGYMGGYTMGQATERHENEMHVRSIT